MNKNIELEFMSKLAKEKPLGVKNITFGEATYDAGLWRDDSSPQPVSFQIFWNENIKAVIEIMQDLAEEYIYNKDEG